MEKSELMIIIGENFLEDGLRHGDGLLVPAGFKRLVKPFADPDFGLAYLDVTPEGVRMVISPKANVDQATRKLYDGKVIVQPDHLAPTNAVRFVKDNSGNDVSLYNLWVNSVRMQLLLIKYKDEIVEWLAKDRAGKSMEAKLRELAAQ